MEHVYTDRHRSCPSIDGYCAYGSLRDREGKRALIGQTYRPGDLWCLTDSYCSTRPEIAGDEHVAFSDSEGHFASFMLVEATIRYKLDWKHINMIGAQIYLLNN